MKIDTKKLILAILPILVDVITDIVTDDKKKKKK
jgi:hypothetical protein